MAAAIEAQQYIFLQNRRWSVERWTKGGSFTPAQTPATTQQPQVQDILSQFNFLIPRVRIWMVLMPRDASYNFRSHSALLVNRLCLSRSFQLWSSFCSQFIQSKSTIHNCLLKASINNWKKTESNYIIFLCILNKRLTKKLPCWHQHLLSTPSGPLSMQK